MDTLSVQPILSDDLLRAFVAFAEAKSFTHASGRIGLSQPALFERVRKLGELLDVKLYEKQGKALKLTAQGIQLAAFARDMLAQAARFTEEISGCVAERVTLAAGEGSYLYLLGKALQRCRVEFDGELSLLTLGGPRALEAVLLGSAQLAVGVFDVVPRRLVVRDLLTVPVCAAIRTRHPLGRRKSLRLQDIAGERLILAPAGRQQRESVTRAIASVGVSPQAPIDADGWPQMLCFAKAGLGVAVVNGACAAPKGVALVPVPELGTVTYRLVWRRGAVTSPAIEQVSKIIQSSIAPSTDAL
ncbi:LysR family transcriptional regulator [Enhygromyxa salina]|uniref:LysR family transcriptional regulator n=1 Tax=Enhygromyxa salina TaxID=215803 RepID=UPI0011BA8286|nr:LysR family transcriptional regulator [Enhygromyxa salina]